MLKKLLFLTLFFNYSTLSFSQDQAAIIEDLANQICQCTKEDGLLTATIEVVSEIFSDCVEYTYSENPEKVTMAMGGVPLDEEKNQKFSNNLLIKINKLCPEVLQRLPGEKTSEPPGLWVTTIKQAGKLPEVAVAPDGQSILTWSSDAKLVRRWSLTGQQLASFETSGRFVDAAFSPDGKLVLVKSAESTKLWRVNGDLVLDLSNKMEGYFTIMFSPDNTIVAAKNGKMVKLWDVSGKLIANTEHPAYVSTISFSPDGRLLLVNLDNLSTWIRDAKGNLLKKIKHDDGEMRSEMDRYDALFSPDGNYFLTYSPNQYYAKYWDSRGNFIAKINGRYYPVFSAAGNYFLTHAHDGIYLWDNRGNKVKHIPFDREVFYFDFFPDGKSFYTLADEDAFIQLWDLKGNLLTTLKAQEEIYGLEVSPDGQLVLAGSSWDEKANLWNRNGQLIKSILHAKTYSNYPGAFSPDGQYSATISENGGAAVVWDAKGNQVAKMVETELLTEVQFLPDNQHLLTQSYDGSFKVWRLKK